MLKLDIWSNIRRKKSPILVQIHIKQTITTGVSTKRKDEENEIKDEKSRIEKTPNQA